MNHETLESLRFCFQKILVPCAVIIGFLGNSVSVLVLTRKRMRCSTNIYLTALAIADIIYLSMVLILSFQHYKSINHPRYELYWRTYGLLHWICDAAAYTSIYITVSFTVERYIAVCHPIRGQVLCTESKAKKVIAIVPILCLLCTSTTTFEYQLEYTPTYVDRKTSEPCILSTNITQQIPPVNCSLPSRPVKLPPLSAPPPPSTEVITPIPDTRGNHHLESATSLRGSEGYDYYQDDDPPPDEPMHHTGDTGNTVLESNNAEPVPDSINGSAITSGQEDNCHCLYFLEAVNSPLGENEVYRQVFMWSTSVVFTFIPLILLLTFNSFLILAVRRSNRLRDEMTNVNSRKVKQKVSSISHENKITVTLIAVVILFIICQTPTAIFIIITASSPGNISAEVRNVHHAMGNIFNFLITFNAACNFLLYCALSEKYRQTVKELIMGRKYMRQNTLKSLYLNRHGTLGDSWYNSRYQTSHNKSRNDSTPSTRKSSARSIDKTRDSRNSYPHLPIPEQRPSIAEMTPRSRKNSAMPYGCDDPQRGTNNSPSSRFLKPSDSQGSLSRSRSLVFKPKTKHSPNCREFDNNL